ncbi:MAG: 3-oxoacid CoA-transferase subunit B [Pseudomonadota bacterium]|nr:3-oxoacid CoA-transferase subunit B [Pseudomonadota bacterium]
MGLSRNQIAWKIAQDIEDNSYVNLGIGMPELIANFIPQNREIVIHSENGLLGMGPSPQLGYEDNDLINAGKKPITLLDGGSYFSHADSFAMIRGGHIDLCVLGAFQVSELGDLANWATLDNSKPPGVGGAMDLAAGAKKVFIMTNHCTNNGISKIVTKCSYPLTSSGVVNRIYTDLAVIDITKDGLVLREKISSMSFEELQQKTGAPLDKPSSVIDLIAPDL